jgi:hypothetical protein
LAKYLLQYGLESMWEEAFTTNLKYYVDYNRWYRMMSLHNMRCSVIGKDVNECCHDLNWSDIWTGKDVTGCSLDPFVVLCALEKMIEDNVMT